MAIWTRLADGRLVNSDCIMKWQVDNRELKAFHVDGTVTAQVFATADLAQSAFEGVVDSVELVVSTTGLSLDHLTPSTGASGGLVNAVLVGSGFQFDLVTASFAGTITIGGDAVAVTYVDSNTLLLLWTPSSPGVKDLIYTAKDGVTTKTLTGAFTAS